MIKIETPILLNSVLIWKGGITVATDFPTLALVKTGWVYTILANVTDNNATKTNTGQSFVVGDEIVWNGTNWTNIGGVLSGYVTSPLNTSTATNLTGVIKGNGSVLSADNSIYQPAGSYEVTTNKVTSISGSSTDTQYGSAKLLYDQLNTKLNKTDNNFQTWTTASQTWAQFYTTSGIS